MFPDVSVGILIASPLTAAFYHRGARPAEIAVPETGVKFQPSGLPAVRPWAS